MATRLKMLHVAIVIFLALLNLTARAAYVTDLPGIQFAHLLGLLSKRACPHVHVCNNLLRLTLVHQFSKLYFI